MNDEERAFREGLQQAVADRAGGVRVDVDEVIARASAPDFGGESRRTPPRWLAAAAAVALVAGLGATVWFARTPTAIPAVPMAPVTSTPASGTDVASLDLAGTKWRAIQIDGRGVQTVSDDKAPGLEFVSATEVVTSDGCNASRRGYELKPIGVILQFSFGLAGAQTEIGCNVAQQQRFSTALNVVIGVRLSGETLEFLDANDAVVLRFSRARDAETPQPTEPPTGNPTDSVTVVISTPAALPSSLPSATSTTVRVRVQNVSKVAFDEVKLVFPDETKLTVRKLAAGAQSDYVEPAVAYRYTYVEATIGGHTYRIQPDDYVGEKELTPGNYTYSLDFVDGNLLLSFGD